MTRRNTIGGRLGMQEYAVLANLHRPTDPEALTAEIHQLHRGGLKPLDISTALRLSVVQVAAVLAAGAATAIRADQERAP